MNLLNYLKSKPKRLFGSLIKNTISRSDKSKDLENENVALFTNLGINSIDGSITFIKNTIKTLNHLDVHVHLIVVYEPEGQFLEFTQSQKLLSCHVVKHEKKDVCAKIKEAISVYDCKQVIIRSWGTEDLWFSKSYAKKVYFYAPLVLDYTAIQLKIFKKCNIICQTELVLNRIKKYNPNVNALIFPPAVAINKHQKKNITKGYVNISYIGTLRAECQSYHILDTFLSLLEKYEKINIFIIVGKIINSKINKNTSENILGLLDKLGKDNRVVIKHKLSQQECFEYFRNSHITMAYWDPTEQNNNQISTKMLEGLSNFCFVIANKQNHFNRKLMGEHEKYLLKDISDCEIKMSMLIDDINEKNIFLNRNFQLRDYFVENSILQIAKLGLKNKKKENYERYFNNCFDNIYGLYINDKEHSRLDRINENYNLNIQLIKGVNGKEELKEEYTNYSDLTLHTEWEKRNEKKRLTIGAMGHLKSFIKIIEDAIKNDYQKILILEADVYFNKDIFEKFIAVKIHDFKILYLGAGKWNHNINRFDGYYKPNETTGTFAIAFDCSVFQECLDLWKQQINPTDVCLWELQEKYNDEIFVLDPNLIICDLSHSNTQFTKNRPDLYKKFDWNLDNYEMLN